MYLHLLFVGIQPRYEARLTANKGKKTRNPDAAARPIPMKELRM
jgi:hypothetical protein